MTILRQFIQGLRLWVTVTPWEQAIRVRYGKRLTLLNAGMHFKLPVFDMIYLQSVRLRVSNIPKQVVTSLDGRTISISCSLGYTITDISLLYKTLHHPEDTLANLCRSSISSYVAEHHLDYCTPSEIENSIVLDFSKYGLSCTKLYINEFAVTRTYRLIGDYSDYQWGSKLSTDALHNRTPQ